jgi:hypothetical protein
MEGMGLAYAFLFNVLNLLTQLFHDSFQIQPNARKSDI